MHLLATGVIEEDTVDALFSRSGKRKMAEQLQKVGVTEAQPEHAEAFEITAEANLERLHLEDLFVEPSRPV